MIPAGFVQDLLQRTDIAEVVGRRVALRKAGINLKGLCPFHGEKTPSFIVSPSRQTYHCFGCGAHGDAIRFLMEESGLGFLDAVQDLAQQAGLTVPDDPRTAADRARDADERERERTLGELLSRACDHYRQQLKASPAAIAYLKRRGLSGEIAARYGIGYAPAGWRSLASAFPSYDDPRLVEAGLVIAGEADGDGAVRRYDRFRDRIMFPIRSVRGEIIGFGGRVLDQGEPKYLNSPETPVFVKGRELYGLHEARSALRSAGLALVVEGYMDVVALAQHGLGHAVATLGTACTPDHVQKLFRFTDTVVFSFDGDAAGRRAARRALEAALPHLGEMRAVRFLFLPQEHDPDSFVRERGAAAFSEAVDAAWPLSRMLVQAASEDADPATPEGRARLLAQARPLVALLPPGLLREQMVAEFARLGGVAADALQRSWSMTERAGRTPPREASHEPFRPAGRATARPLRRPTATLLDRAAWLLLQRSEMWESVAGASHDRLIGQPAPYGPFFGWIDRQIHDHGPMTESALRDQLRAEEDAEPLHTLAERLGQLHALDPQIDLAAELASVLRQLQLQAIEDEISLLIESGADELDEAPRRRLRELMQLRAQLKSAAPPAPASAR